MVAGLPGAIVDLGAALSILIASIVDLVPLAVASGVMTLGVRLFRFGNRRIYWALLLSIAAYGLVVIIVQWIDAFYFNLVGRRIDYELLHLLTVNAIATMAGTEYGRIGVGIVLGAAIVGIVFIRAIFRALNRIPLLLQLRMRAVLLRSSIPCILPLIFLALPSRLWNVSVPPLITESSYHSLSQIFAYSTKRMTKSKFGIGHEFRIYPFTPGEKGLLKHFCLSGAETSQSVARPFKRVIALVVENLGSHWLHTYNPTIDPLMSAFFDELLKSYPHLDQYWNTKIPTFPALCSMLSSKIDPDPRMLAGPSVQTLYSILEQNRIEATFFRGTYGGFDNARATYPAMFKMQRLILGDDLTAKYRRAWQWGMKDEDVLQELIEIMGRKKAESYFFFVKLVDTHEPRFNARPVVPAPQGWSKEALSFRSENEILREFFAKVSQHNLLDDDTLLIFTGDHVDRTIVAEPGRLPIVFITRDKSRIPLRIDKVGSQLDFAPTVLDLFGIEASPHFVGRSLFDHSCRGIGITSFKDSIYFRDENLNFRFTSYQRNGLVTLREPLQQTLYKWYKNYSLFEKMPLITPRQRNR